MPTLIKPIEFPGVDNILNDWEKYRDIFINQGLIAFRNAFVSFEEQKRLMVGLGEKIGWKVANAYNEDHNTLEKQTNDHCILNWHVEHSYWENPICAASWNMHTFKEEDSKNGRTLFYPMDKYFENLSDEDKEFALSAYIKVYHEPKEGHGLNEFADPHKHWKIGDEWIANRPIAVDHFLTGKKTYRIANLGVQPNHLGKINCLDNINGEKPTKEQIAMYAKQTMQTKMKVAKSLASETDDICLIHEWQEGDLLIPDLFKMAHSITGGFDSRKRKFRGWWATKNNWEGTFDVHYRTLPIDFDKA
jgi:alpha-ketoglutarate-dependent taurine dioxygenase